MLDLIDYLPLWSKLLAAAVFFLVAAYVAIPHIKSLQYLSSSHISSNEPSTFDRIRALKEYARYSYRTFKYDGIDSDNPPLVRNRAKIKGFDKDGLVHLDVYTLKGRMSAKGLIADVDIHDKKLALSIIKRESSDAVVVDTYTIEKKLFL